MPQIQYVLMSNKTPMISPYSFAGIPQEKIKPLTPGHILDVAAKVSRISVERLTTRGRYKRVVGTRQACIYIMYHYLRRMRVMDISELFGVNHSTITTSCQAVQNRIDTNDDEIHIYYDILKELKLKAK